MRLLVLLMMVGLVMASCRTTKIGVEFDYTRLPSEDYQSIRVVGVVENDEIITKHRSYLLEKLKKCPQFGKIKTLPAKIEANFSNEGALIKSLSQEMQNQKGVDGVDAVLVISSSNVNQHAFKDPSQYAKITDLDSFAYYPESSFNEDNKFSAGGGLAIAPKTKSEVFDVDEASHTYDLKTNFAFYKIAGKKVLASNKIETKITVSNYTKDNTFAPNTVKELIIQGMMDRIAWQICDSPLKVERTMYAPSGDDKTSTMIQEGLDLIKKKSWNEGASKFQKAVEADNQNGFAHYDLGVYYERMGDPLKAAEHYKKARVSSRVAASATENLSNLMYKSFERFKDTGLLPFVFSAPSGYWVQAEKPARQKISEDRVYSVYRIRNQYDSSYRIIGTNISEVGQITVVKNKKTEFIGRVSSFLLPEGITVGDFVLIK